MKQLRILVAAAAISLGLAAGAAAASGSGASAPPRHAPEAIARQAKQVERVLAEKGARLAIVARIGRDPATLPKGLTYTHAGFWVHSEIVTGDGERLFGYAVHNLYQRDDAPDRSALVRDFPAEFLAGAFHLKVAAIVPKPELQARLISLVGQPAYAKLHNPHYSVIANPLAAQYQNCTGFILDLVMAAVYRTEDVAQIKANVAAHFTPQPIEISDGKRLLASLFAREVATRDHGPVIATATMESLTAFMLRAGLAEEAFEIEP